MELIPGTHARDAGAGTRPARDAAGKPGRGAVRMPDLANATAAHAHTVHSALVTLEALGIGLHRLRLRRVGRDARAVDAIVRQSPPAGTPVGADTVVQLDIAGLGFMQALPVGMWDSGGDSALGTREILEVFDDPLEKLKHWFHEGAPLFRLASDDLQACARWLSLFGLDPADWPESLWYRLASLIANIPKLACSEDGCAFVLNVLLRLPVRQFRYRPGWAEMPEEAISALGSRASRLGVDLLVGDRAEHTAVTVLEVGPVALETYELFVETEAGVSLLRRVLDLVMPLSSAHEVQWLVHDPARPPQLGVARANGRLGVNSHMGAARPAGYEAQTDAEHSALPAVNSAGKETGMKA